MARISASASSMFGTGFLIHRNLLLTTHVNLPSVAAAEGAEIRLQNGVAACLFPHRYYFFTLKYATLLYMSTIYTYYCCLSIFLMI